ncbi:hypothetical protein FJY63_07915 [Candidatus Sumerlaeota bacterium]|nr:hypothetical protein [Candidatus Sumerlaeota bacterium]
MRKETTKPRGVAFARVISVAALVVLAGALSSCLWFDDYRIGVRNFKEEDYPYAIVRLSRYLEKTPKAKPSPVGLGERKNAERREEALIDLALAYQKMQAYRDAENAFRRYQEEFPNGRFVELVQQSLARIAQNADQRNQKLAEEVAAAQKDVLRLRAELDKAPGSAERWVALGNAHWKLGQWKSAGEAYLKGIEIEPKLRDEPLLKERLIFDLNGNLVPITDPQERVRLEQEREPLVIEDLHEYTSRGVDDFVAARRRFYMVTGTVRNRSTRPVLGVQVEVTFLDSLGRILEVGTASVGTLYPLESRPFVVRAGLDAEAMGNIARYRCQTLFQR